MVRDEIAAINRQTRGIARIHDELRAILDSNAQREETRQEAELEYFSYRYSRQLGASAALLALPFRFGDRAVILEARYNAERNKAIALSKGRE